MPIISISTYSGRTQREKDRLAEAITEDVKKIFNVDKKDVIIVFHEEPYGNWYADGIRLCIGTSTLMQYILTRYDMHMVNM